MRQDFDYFVGEGGSFARAELLVEPQIKASYSDEPNIVQYSVC
jgi:hypothetical protein